MQLHRKERHLGNFYTNIVLHEAAQPDVIRVLERLERNAFVSPVLHGKTVVYDAECDQQDPAVLGKLPVV